MDRCSAEDKAIHANALSRPRSRRVARGRQISGKLEMSAVSDALRDTDLDESQLQRRLLGIWRTPPGIVGWLSSVDHKQIALRYIVTAFVFLGLGGISAALMALQLALPDNHLVSADKYDQLFTMHGSTMMFLFAVPVMHAFAVYFVPLMIGTRNVAFPRLNAFSYWVYLFGGAMLWF